MTRTPDIPPQTGPLWQALRPLPARLSQVFTSTAHGAAPQRGTASGGARPAGLADVADWLRLALTDGVALGGGLAIETLLDRVEGRA